MRSGGMPKKQAPSPSSTAVEQHQQAGEAGVDVPVRHRPAGLVAVGPALVRLGVPVQVGVLVGVRHDDQRGPCACPPATAPDRRRPAWSPPRTGPGPPASSSTRNPQPWEKPADGARTAWSEQPVAPRRAGPAGPGRSCAPSAAGGPPRANSMRVHALRPPAAGCPRHRARSRPAPAMITSRPDRNASGGQVIGSTATERRRRSPGSVSPVNTCHQPNAGVGPDPRRRRPSGAARRDRRAAVGVADPRRRRRCRARSSPIRRGLGEVVLAAGHPGRADRQQPPVDQQPAAGRHPQHQVVDRHARAPAGTGARAKPNGARLAADVGHLVLGAQPVRADAPGGAQPQRPRVPGLRRQVVARRSPRPAPARPAASGTQLTRPWMALCRSGSVRASW